jgi:putative lipoic acid-binding regulatory protein
MTEPSDETLFQFPCRFPVKAMGRADSAIERAVVEILIRHVPGFDVTSITVRESKAGKWLAVTAVIEAHSKAQLDAIYQDLTDHELVVYAL